ncbi:MAG: hypothetical protein NXI20_12230 [bacterium]|nr:hypothetical protein [bacterium]
MKTISSIILAILISNCVFSQDHKDDLQKVLDRIDQIGSASYIYKSESSTFKDTIPSSSMSVLETFLINPKDSIIGAFFGEGSISKNRNLLNYAYDGNYIVRLDWDKKNAVVDTMNNNVNGFPHAPFFIRIKSLIQYCYLNPNENSVNRIEYSDSIKFTIEFNDKVVEFVNLKPIIFDAPGQISKYELIIDKKYLPRKLLRKMPHQWSWFTVSDLETSSMIDSEFSALLQIPGDFTVNNNQQKRINPESIIGKNVDKLEFSTISGDSKSLQDVNEHVILIQLTGMGCGYCHNSIQFLKSLKDTYKSESFEIFSFEYMNRNADKIQRYVDRNEINYNYVIPTQETLNFFNSPTVPVFILINRKREITDAFIGYDQGNSEEPIISAIEKLL